ncbi:complement C3-like isoform X2 [Synchiropus splendidus]|uniref:complement C3-like isoform X2 n=1 Tax=Synchiropus splendidus TaxID=270530 RepID=UPI00237DFFF9|nr:complement C3-like isoform X2 [Synchiropus splendidus]
MQQRWTDSMTAAEHHSRMGGSGLWLLVPVAFACFSSLAEAAPLTLMSVPSIMRVGGPENIFVECQDCSGGEIRVNIYVKDFPSRTNILAQTTVNLNTGNHFQGLAAVTIPAEGFSKDPNANQFVYLQAQFPDRLLQRVVMVTFQAGYMFIQTDKTLYTPNTKVYYRVFGLTPQMGAIETDASVAIEIMTPEGHVVYDDQIALNSGLLNGEYQLGELVSLGVWKVVTRFQDSPQKKYFAEFEVKEYVLPSFEVQLKSQRPFYFINDPELTIDIRAKYLFGKEVEGVAYVIFEIATEERRIGLPGSLQRVQIEKGKGTVTLKREHITQTFPNIQELEGKSIVVAVRVLTSTGSDMVEQELKGILIVSSPYTINFRRTPKYFKPSLSMDVWVEVLNPDGSPAGNIPVTVNPGEQEEVTNDEGIAKVPIDTASGDTRLRISAATNDPNIQGHQATATMEATAYQSNSRNYISISVNTEAKLKLGDNMKVTLNMNMQNNKDNIDITVLLMSKGQLVRFIREKTQSIKRSRKITITKELVPSFRIIAYYHAAENELVSDSVWVDVHDTCTGTLKLELVGGPRTFKPSRVFDLKVTGDPGAAVGLVAVDKGVYVLNSKHRLTQQKIWDLVEKHDTGCTPGGGRDAMNVFYDAGLLLESSTASGTQHRKELKCPTISRRRRSLTLREVTESLVSYFTEKLEKECCQEGMTQTLLSYSCETRSEYITEGPACVTAFVYCCTQLESQRPEMKPNTLLLARVDDDDDSYIDSNDIRSRSKFPESWLWTYIHLPACAPGERKCKTKSIEKDFPLQDSITTWQVTGISLSKSNGICVGDPLEVIVEKSFFVELKLPYSAVIGEQIEIKAILHNYRDEGATVRVDLIEKPHLCSSASKRGKYRQEVIVGPQSTRSVPYVIIPMKEGEHQIEVKAAVRDTELTDGIQKPLRVVSRGVLVKSPLIVHLDPAKEGVDGKQTISLNSGIPKKDIVPNSPTNTYISVTGREDLSVVLENAIRGTAMEQMIYQPSGCGEQNMIHMTLPVIATLYLDRTNQWEDVGLTKRDEALQHIETGYSRQLTYRKNDGSFAAWTKRPSSSWLTAYVVKVFSMAERLIQLKNSDICDAVKYLILNAQQPHGLFEEIGTLIHGEMNGDVKGGDSDASMTAFVLIALQESHTHCNASIGSLPGAIEKSITFLEKRLPSLTNPYAVAMTSYALANEGKLQKDVLFRFAAPDRTHWPTPKGHVYSLEATAYALLALVKVKAFEEAKPIVRWFSKQKKVGGGFGSTQATIIVYQAVSEYWANAREPQYDLKVDLMLPGRSLPDRFSLNRRNHFATRTSKFNEINKDVDVVATGTGEATLTMVSLYYAIPKEKESDCGKFNLSVQLIPDTIEDEEEILILRMDVLYKHPYLDATMTILDIGLLTGFVPETKDLEALVKGRAAVISKYEMNNVLSERGSLIIYLDKVSHKRPEEITFRVRRKTKVGVLQAAAVSVYEYYDQTPCVKFYHPERKDGKLLRLCTKDECKCAEETCSMQRKGEISNNQRLAKLCESTETNSIDYVYKVSVESFSDALSTDVYTMRIMEVIKEGSLDLNSQGEPRKFLGYPYCRGSFDLRPGQTYLIMGSSSDTYKDDTDGTYQYVLGEKTWIEYWPSPTECQEDLHRSACLGIRKMVNKYQLVGCEQ